MDNQKDFPGDSLTLQDMEEQLAPPGLTTIDSYDEDAGTDSTLRSLIRKASTASLQGLGNLSHRGMNGKMPYIVHSTNPYMYDRCD